MPRLLWLACPECHQPGMLGCAVAGTRESLEVTLVEQVCVCDPYDAWDDVWEAARECVIEDGCLD